MLLRQNIICTALFCAGLLLPDWFLGSYTKTLSCTIPFYTLLGSLGFALILSTVKNRSFLFLIIAIITITQAIQLNHWAYFGAPIHSQDITKAFVELDEILKTGSSICNTMWPVWLSQTISLIFLILGALHTKKCINISYAWVIVILLLAINPILSYIKGSEFFYTKSTSSTLYNTSRAFSDWLVNSHKTSTKYNYKPYEITFTEPKIKNIVLIIGESLSSRYMQLYGYTQANTPFLEQLKSDKNFAFAKGVSSSVSTITCLQLFFNNLHNPGFTELIRNKSANLFYLAHHQGYKTFILSAQNEKLFHETGTEFVDYFCFEKNQRKLLRKKGDEALLDNLSKLKFNDKNFIVIQLRHIHSPFNEYAKYHPELKQIHQHDSRETQTQHEYSNAIAYHDYWVKQCISCIKKTLPNDTIIIFTSDHGELVSEHGLFGHNLMYKEVADVPVWAYTIDANSSLNNYLKKQQICSHYDLGKQIASLLGANIINPNEEPELQFVHGTELHTDYQLIPWKKSNGEAEFSNVQRVSEVVGSIQQITEQHSKDF